MTNPWEPAVKQAAAGRLDDGGTLVFGFLAGSSGGEMGMVAGMLFCTLEMALLVEDIACVTCQKQPDFRQYAQEGSYMVKPAATHLVNYARDVRRKRSKRQKGC